MELKDTAKMMKSKDYKERFIAEYYQTKIRYAKLHEMLVKFDAHKLEFRPDSPIRILRKQAKSMGNYLYCLEVRAKCEDIDLSEVNKVEEKEEGNK